MKKIYYLLFAFAFSFQFLRAQIGIGTLSPHASSMLDISASDKGLLVPRVSLTGTNDNTTIAGSATSLLVYNTNTSTPGPNQVTPGYYYWDGSVWLRLSTGAGSGDNLGDHKATQNIEMMSNYLSGDGDNEGIFVDNDGRVGIGFVGPFFSPLNLRGSGLFDATISSQNTTGGIEWRYGALNDGSFSFVKITGMTYQALTLEYATGNVFLSGDANRKFGLSRTNTGSGNTLTIESAGAEFLSTNQSGGNLLLSSGISTGNAGSNIQFNTATSGVSGTSDNIPTEKMRITSSGNVGIGTTSPSTLLHLNKVDGGEVLRITSLTSGDPHIKILSDGAQTIIGSNNTTTGFQESFVGSQNSYPLALRTNNANRIFISSSGNVGIGTSSPSTNLDVIGTIRFQGYTSGVNGGILTTNTSGDLGVNNFSGNANDVLRGNGTFGAVPGGGNNWGILGNSGTNPLTNFLGTIDNQNLVFRTNNAERVRITTKGNIEVLNSARSVFLGEGAGLLQDNSADRFNTGLGNFSLASITTGNNNIGIGSGALYTATTTFDNVAIGNNAMYSVSTGSSNTAIGAGALSSGDVGSYNVAVGSSALPSNQSGNNNIAIGYRSALLNTTASYNTVVGNDAYYSNRAGSFAVVIGAEAMFYANNTFTSFTNRNIAIGYQAYRGSAIPVNNTGNDNTVIGYQALTNNVTGSFNTAIGVQSLQNNTYSGQNTAIGYQALRQQSFTNGNTDWNTGNTAIGYRALMNNQPTANNNGYLNTAVGLGALMSNTTGSGSVAIGSSSLTSATTANYNIGIGLWALSNTTIGSNNIAIGTNAMQANTTGASNVVIGHASMQSSTSSSNTIVGAFASFNTTSGGQNTVLGFNSYEQNRTGSGVVAIGFEAMRYANNTLTAFNNFNTAIGYQAYRGSITPSANTGNLNTVVGYRSLFSNSSGSSNTALGISTLINNTIGSGNTAIGDSALTSVTLGNFNTAIGYLSNTTSSLENATAIGYRAFVQQNNSMVLGSIAGLNGATDNTNVGIGTTAPSSILHLRRNASIPVLTLQLGDAISLPNTILSQIQAADATSGAPTNQASIAFYRDAASSGPTDLPTAIGFNVTKDGNSVPSEVMRITNIGNVGIGTANPNHPLDVFGTINALGFTASNAAPVGSFLKGNGISYTTGYLSASDIPSGSNVYIQNQTLTNQIASFRINGNSYFDGGRLGIGTITPFNALEVRGYTDANESVFRFGIQDSPNDHITLWNGIGTAGLFQPVLQTNIESNNLNAFTLRTQVAPAQDAGTNPIFTFEARRNDNSQITNRPLFQWTNQSTVNLLMDVQGRLRTMDRDIFLRNDANHGLGWYGTGKLFNGYNIDGPVIYGYGGGALGWNDFASSAQGVSLRWMRESPISTQSFVSINSKLTPSIPLMVVRENGFSEGHFLSFSNTSEYSALVLGKARGTELSPSASQSGNVLGALIFRGHSGAGWQVNASQIRCDAPENFNGSAAGSRIVISTVPNGTISPQPRLTVDHNGNIALGNFTPGYRLHASQNLLGYVASIDNTQNVAGANGMRIIAGQNTYTAQSRFIAFFRPDLVEIGSITQNATNTVAYNTTSDARLKNVLSVSSFGLKQLNQILVVDYTFKSDPNQEIMNGFLAQQLFEHYPFAVSKPQKDEDVWQIDYGKLTPLLVQSVQDLSKENQVLKSQLEEQHFINAQLKKELDEQKSEIQKIKEYLNLNSKN